MHKEDIKIDENKEREQNIIIEKKTNERSFHTALKEKLKSKGIIHRFDSENENAQ